MTVMVSFVLKLTVAVMVIYHLAYTQVLIQNPTAHRVTHLGFAFLVVFLSLLRKGKGSKLINLGLSFGSVIVTAYFLYSLNNILLFRSAMPSIIDLVMGVIAVTLAFVATYKAWGKTFIIIAVISLLYLVFGIYLPRPFNVPKVPFERIVVWLSIPGTEEGVYGTILSISANYLFLILLFGALLHGFGGTRFILSLGKWLGSKLVSGPAAVAVFSSALLGMITGSTVGNIAITGAFAIPMMKKAGYSAEQAGAISAASSNGGQIMPPVMGAAAFVMAGYAGIPYLQIAAAAVIPALLYFFCIFLYVQLNAHKIIKVGGGIVKKLSGKQLLDEAPAFFIPLGVLVFLLLQGFSLPFVGFWSIITLVIVGSISEIRKEARINIKEIVEATIEGVRMASEVAVSCALIGVVVTCVLVSGLGMKLPMLIQEISGGNILIALLIAMVSSLILGMGVPTTAAYILVAIGLVPALTRMGVPVLQAHFFPFMFACVSNLTPPVAYGVLIASRMAGGDYWKTGWEAVKAAFVSFLLPFFVIYSPVVVLRPEGSLILGIAKIAAIFLAILSLQIGMCNFFLTSLRVMECIAFVIAGLLCVVFVFTKTYPYFIVGGLLFLVCTAVQLRKRSWLKTINE